MYQESETGKQAGLWPNNGQPLGKQSRKLYEDPRGWHNEFRRQVTDRVDESIFKTLFSDDCGAPNAPIRVLVAMMALKEGKGVSDEELFEQARFNVLLRSALGLVQSDEEPPAESTYYLFRKRIVEYEGKHGKNLLEEGFRALTKGHCAEFKVKGQRIRMDSKLLGSNLAWFTRYEIVHETIRKYWGARTPGPDRLTAEEKQLLAEIMKEAGHTVNYRSTKEEVKERLEALGRLMYWLLKEPGAEGKGEYGLLQRVFEEQYEITTGGGGGKEKRVGLREQAGSKEGTEEQAPGAAAAGGGTDERERADKAEANSGDVQEAPGESGGGKEERVQLREKAEKPSKIVTNPHDPEAEYRTKAGKTITGYAINVTETCDEGNLHLIVDVQAAGAGTGDGAFFKEAIAGAQMAVCGEIKEAYTDGGFHSPGNQEYCREEEIDWVLRGISGKPSKYELCFNAAGKLEVTNRESGERLEAKRARTRDPEAPERWVVKDGEHAAIYFERKDVETSALRKRLAALPLERINLRNNVEATIFQLGYHYRGNKSSYRGLTKHLMWAVSRSTWVNFRRILKWVGEQAEGSGACRIVHHVLEALVRLLWTGQLVFSSY